jgi:hypothetical protein
MRFVKGKNNLECQNSLESMGAVPRQADIYLRKAIR